MEIVKYLITAFVLYTIGDIIYRNYKNADFLKLIWRGVTIRLFLECIGVIVMVITSSYYLTQVKFLSYGWSDFVFGDGSGNVTIAPFSGNAYIYIPFLLVLIFILPFLAHAEEQVFRSNVTTPPKVLLMSLLFGLIHLIMGIPLGVALSLSIAGLYFAYKYNSKYRELLPIDGKKGANVGATICSTTAHTVYNFIVLTVILLTTIIAL